MYGGVWYGGMTYGGYVFDPDDLGTFTLGLDPCYNLALGYAGDWYAGLVYAGTPFCLEDFGFFEAPAPGSNVVDVCIVRC